MLSTTIVRNYDTTCLKNRKAFSYLQNKRTNSEFNKNCNPDFFSAKSLSSQKTEKEITHVHKKKDVTIYKNTDLGKKMKIGIIGAMEEEVSLIKKDFESISIEEIANRKYYSGKLHGIDSVLVFSRWGKVASASTATTLITKYNIDFLIFTGVAGAAHPDLSIGDIVIAKDLLQHDMNAAPFFPKFQIPLTNFSYLPVHEEIYTHTKHAVEDFLTNINKKMSKETLKEFNINSPKSFIGTIASGDQFIADVEKVKSLSLEIENLMCVEMEGAAVAQVCSEHGIKYAVVRVISDKADHSAPVDFQKFIEKVASEYSRVIIENMYHHLFSKNKVGAFEETNSNL